MNEFRLAVACLAIAAVLGPYRAPAEAQSALKVDWHTDQRKAFEESRKTGKPLWVLFR